MKVKIKKLSPDAVIPSYAKEGDAAMDLTAITVSTNWDYLEYGTGLAIEIPEGYVGLVFPRSSVSKKSMVLANSVGVIDSGYRGEIKCRFKRLPEETTKEVRDYYQLSGTPFYGMGDKVAQIMIIPTPFITFVEAEELSSTERGEGGFGSTNIETNGINTQY